MTNAMAEDTPGPDTYESHFRNNNGRLMLIFDPPTHNDPLCAKTAILAIFWFLTNCPNSVFFHVGVEFFTQRKSKFVSHLHTTCPSKAFLRCRFHAIFCTSRAPSPTCYGSWRMSQNTHTHTHILQATNEIIGAILGYYKTTQRAHSGEGHSTHFS